MSAPGDTALPIDLEIDVALDAVRLDEIARRAALAASYWRSIELAADRGNRLGARTEPTILPARDQAACLSSDHGQTARRRGAQRLVTTVTIIRRGQSSE